MYASPAHHRRLTAGLAGAGLLAATLTSLGAAASADELRPGEPGRPGTGASPSPVLAASTVSPAVLGDPVEEEEGVPFYCDLDPAGGLILGTPGDDSIVGTPGDDVIVTFGGDDEIDGGDGNDVICAGAGDDEVRGGAGNDIVYGQGGRDTLLGGAGRDSLDGDDGRDSISGGAGRDVIEGGADRDILRGGPDNDVIDGLTRFERESEGRRHEGEVDRSSCFIPPKDHPYSDADQIYGGPGDDRLHGGPGNDCIKGEEGNDLVRAGQGADQVAGGLGSDLLLGEGGPDTMYSGPRSFGFEKGAPPLYDGAPDVLLGGSDYDALYATIEDDAWQ